MKWNWIVFIWLLACGNAMNAGEYSITNNKNTCYIPFKTFNDLIIVELTINNQRPLKFIFDSGCKNAIIIKPSLVDSFATKQNTRLYFSGMGSNDSVEVVKYNNCTIKLGTITGKNLSVYNLSEDYLNFESYLGVDVDGIFGAELFEKFYVHINYKTHFLELSKQKPKKLSTFQQLNVSVRGSKGYLKSFITSHEGHTFLIDLLLDTGANLPLIIKNEDPELLEVNHYIEAEVGEGLSGSIYAKVGRVQHLFISAFRFDSIVCAFHENAAYAKELDPNMINGNIGNELLNRFDIYFAYPDSCIYIRPLSTISKPFEFHLINIILNEDKTKEGYFVIKSVATNTAPYDAGLRDEDKIVAIDRYDSDDLKLEDAINLLNKRIGKKIKIKYIRDNKPYICTYIVQPII